MPVPSVITDLSTTAASNSPAGSENASTTDDYLRAHASFIAQLYADKAKSSAAALTSASTSDGEEIGWRDIPSVSSTGLTADVTHRGKCIASTGTVTVPNSTFSAGDAFSVYNNSASSISIAQGSGLTLRLAGTATTGSLTLALRGMCTVWFVSATEAVCAGSGLS